MRGGARTGAGRPSGARSRKTRETLEAVERSGVTPLDYMLSVMRDDAQKAEARLDAAKSAAPYVHPRLASIEHSGELNVRRAEDLTDTELADIAAGSSAGAARPS